VGQTGVVPKFIFDEETLREYASYDPDRAPSASVEPGDDYNDDDPFVDEILVDVDLDDEEDLFYDEDPLAADEDSAPPRILSTPEIDAMIAKYKREPDGQLSEYHSAACELNEEKLEATSRLALQLLREAGVTQIVIRYDGGGDEGFSHFESAKTSNKDFNTADLIVQFENGPLGERHADRAHAYAYREDIEWTRAVIAQYALELLFHQLTTQLLGDGFGTGECSLEGAFVADLNANTLIDIAPEDAVSNGASVVSRATLGAFVWRAQRRLSGHSHLVRRVQSAPERFSASRFATSFRGNLFVRKAVRRNADKFRR
jgi:hypothetical protein